MNAQKFLENVKSRVFRPVDHFPITLVTDQPNKLVLLVDNCLRLELTYDGKGYFLQEFIEGGVPVAHKIPFNTFAEVEDYCVETIKDFQRLRPLRSTYED